MLYNVFNNFKCILFLWWWKAEFSAAITPVFILLQSEIILYADLDLKKLYFYQCFVAALFCE